jgi:hypothetical protein
MAAVDIANNLQTIALVIRIPLYVDRLIRYPTKERQSNESD